MRLGVLASPSGWHFQDLQRAAATLGTSELLALDFGGLQGAAEVGQPPSPVAEGLDVILARIMPSGSLEQIIFRMDLLQQLEANGMLIVNPPRTIEAAVDKFLSMSRWALAGLPVPATRVSQSVDAALDQFQQLGGDVVVKPLFGSLGRGLHRLSDETAARQFFEAAVLEQRVIYQQRFVHHGGWDLRLLVIGDQVWGMKRVRPDHWITNIHQGGRGEPHCVRPQERELALRASQVLGAQVAGVDLIYGPDLDQPLLLELNAAPGWQAISAVLNLDVGQQLIRYLEALSRDRC